jgi:diaminopimelate decarboxylase
MSVLRRYAKSLVVSARHRRNEARLRQLEQPDGTLAPGWWGATISSAGHLVIEGHDATELARQYGTPLHVVSRARLARDLQSFLGAFRRRWPRVEIGYSYKTNPLPGVLRELHARGAWAEVISHFELWLALRLGVPPARVIYNGPAKSDEGLQLAVAQGVGLVNVDNAAEIDRLARIASDAGRRQAVGVRVVGSVGWSGQFGHGIASGAAFEAFARVARHPSLDPCAIHMHLGTGLGDIATYLVAIREALDLARTVERELGIAIRMLDFGGGFGVRTVRSLDAWDMRLMALGYPAAPLDPGSKPDIDAFAAAIVDVLRERYPGDPATAPLVLFEPGRAITSSAQTLLLRVLAVKREGDQPARVILDGGKNIAIPLGYEMHELLPASRMNAPYVSRHAFYGPLCHPGDVLSQCKLFPEVNENDIVAVMDAGAYFVPNQMNFSNPRPAAVMVDEGECRVLRERETFEDIVRLDAIGGAAIGAAESAIRQVSADLRPA